MAIHAMLSREWVHWGETRWLRTKDEPGGSTQLPHFVLRRDSVGTSADDLFPESESVDKEYWSPLPDESGEPNGED